MSGITGRTVRNVDIDGELLTKKLRIGTESKEPRRIKRLIKDYQKIEGYNIQPFA